MTEKIEVDGLTVEFEMPKAGEALDEMLECKGLIRAVSERRIAADEFIEQHKIAEAKPLLRQIEELEFELGTCLQKLLFKIAPALKDEFPEGTTVAQAQALIQKFAFVVMLGGDAVKNLQTGPGTS